MTQQIQPPPTSSRIPVPGKAGTQPKVPKEGTRRIRPIVPSVFRTLTH